MTGKDIKILIASSDTDVIAELTDYLVEQLDVDITLVDTIQDARTVLCSEQIDLIFAGPQLSDGDGRALLQSDNVPVPIILIDDQLASDRVLSAMRLGAADVLCSPIIYDDLDDMIRRLIRRKRDSEHEAVRAQRLRRLSSRLIKDRRELRKRIDLICCDIVTAYQRMAEKVSTAPDLTIPNGAPGNDPSRVL